MPSARPAKPAGSPAADPDLRVMRRGSREPGVPEVEETDLWQRLSRLCLLLIAGVGLLCFLVIFKPQIEHKQKLEAEVRALSDTYLLVRAEADELQQELEWLRGDLNYLESVARDRLDLQKEGEQIIHIIRPERTE